MTITGGTGTVVTIQSVTYTVGGGIYNEGTLVVADAMVEDNWVVAPCSDIPCSSAGGGLFNYNLGHATVRRSVFGLNRADYGGAIYDWAGSTLAVENSTITTNVADFDGGGMLVGFDTATIVSSTITKNIGGGVTSWRSQLTIGNSILADNLGPDCDVDADGPPVQSLGHNLDSFDTCGFNGPGDLPAENARLLPAQMNGGLTPTHALEPSSPAVDAANPSGCVDAGGQALATDQRGAARHADGDGDGTSRCDIGAFELLSTVPTPTGSPTPSPTPTPTAEWAVHLPICRR
jgi:hypothetical protein